MILSHSEWKQFLTILLSVPKQRWWGGSLHKRHVCYPSAKLPTSTSDIIWGTGDLVGEREKRRLKGEMSVYTGIVFQHFREMKGLITKF